MWQKPDLRMNLIPISFTAEKFKGYDLPYESKDQLKALREKYRESHIFRRQGNIIQCILLTEGAGALGKEKEFTIKDDFVLAERLVQAALINFFKERGMQFSRLFSPATLIVERENLIKKVVNDESIACLIPMYPEYQLEGRLIVPHDKDVIFGILLNFGVYHLIDATVQDLIDKKIDVVDCYVVTDAGDKKGSTTSAKFRKKPLAGKIAAIQGSKLKLIDYRDSEEIDASSCYLEPSSRNFRRCLATLCDKDIKDLQQKRMEQIFEVTGAKKQYDRLEKVKDWLKKSEPIRCGGGLSFLIGEIEKTAPPSDGGFSERGLKPPDIIKSEIYRLRAGNEAGEYRQLDNPTYVLRPGNQLPFRGRIDKGIDENGPYDTESFPKKRVRIALLYPERCKGETEVFMKQFKEGVPSRPNKEIPFTQGFTRKYHLTSCEIESFPIPTAKENAEGYKQTSLDALARSTSFDLAFIVTRENFHELQTEKNPYYISKSSFMSQGVPVQSIEIETIMDTKGRPWILNILALATYAKLGGIPYVLAPPKSTNELIFGIGSANIKTRRLGKSERFVGITTVFNGDGNYLLYNLTKEVKYEDYQNALLQSLRECLDEVKARYAWQKGDKVRLIFHQSFKKFKNMEAQAVKEFVNSITDFDIEYAFMHISRSHPWKVYDKNSEGIFHWNNNQKFIKGEYVPQRGFYIPLGPQAALLTLTGPHQLKTHLQGCPEPILISIHHESTFLSQEYLANQIYKLTFMSWKSFSPATMPVTIEYSGMIADLMGHLRAIPNWNPDILATKLRESRWFL